MAQETYCSAVLSTDRLVLFTSARALYLSIEAKRWMVLPGIEYGRVDAGPRAVKVNLVASTGGET